jgi:LCP family protein required for cell wall assembly
VIDKKIINIALFGIDTRTENSFEGLSDSIMVLSLNTETKTVKIISFMRDTLVPIEQPNGKKLCNKINSAYAKGGPELAIKTLNQNFGLDISEYATVNFYGMAEIIDAVGGIEIDVQKQEINGYRRLNDLMEVNESYSIMEVDVPVAWAGKTLIELDIRKHHKVNIILVLSGGKEVISSPHGATMLSENDRIIVGGNNDDIARFVAKLSNMK